MKYIAPVLSLIMLAGCSKHKIDPKYNELLQGKALVIKQNWSNDVIDVDIFTADKLTNNIIYTGETSVVFSCVGELVDEVVATAPMGIGGDPVTVYCENGRIVGLYGRNPIFEFERPVNNETLEKVEKYLSNQRLEPIASLQAHP